MNKCDQVRPRLSAYVDGEVTDDEREHIRRHLDACEPCTKVLGELEETVGLLGRLEDIDPPHTVGQGLKRRLRRRAAALAVFIGLLIVAILPVAANVNIALHPDIPWWARAGFAFSALCFGLGLALLVSQLLQRLRQLVVYGYLSGSQK